MKTTDNILKSIYTTCFSQKFSPDGDLLACSDNFGNISLFRLSNVLGAENIDKVKLPYSKFKAANCSLYALESTNEFLITAPLNEIIGWRWKDLAQNKTCTKPLFTLKFKSNDMSHNNSLIETNSLLYDTESSNKRIFAGCGNGVIYNFDLETNRLISKFEGHEDSIYQIVMKNNSDELISASEDGEIKIWDLRSKNCTASVKPYEFPMCARPHLGKHLNCIAVDDENWLICGGGPRMAMWHLRSMKPMSLPEFEDELFVPNVCKIYQNQIITGGNSRQLYIHTFENKLRTKINTSINCIYDLSINYASKSNKIVCVAGSGASIDICSNFSYKAATLNL